MSLPTSLLVVAAVGAVSAQRTLSFVNNCAKDAQMLATSGATDGGYLDNPTPTNGYTIAANGGTTAVTYTANGNVYWSGNHRFWFGDASACTTPASGGPYAGCQVTGPATEAEYTFLTSTGGSVDTYDVSNINGINVPMSITPNNPQPVSGDDYSCGSAGMAFGDTWVFDPPSDNYQFVDAAGDACTSNSDCASGVCGFTFVAGVGITQGCGNLLGYWTVDEICPLDTGNLAFDCSEALTVGSEETTLGALSGCNYYTDYPTDTVTADVGSCYQAAATNDDCCGCINWQDTISAVPSSTGTCVASSTTWTDNILPTIEWIKEGAPSTYTYPYDDISSTFTCALGDYTITLCPDGTTLPA